MVVDCDYLQVYTGLPTLHSMIIGRTTMQTVQAKVVESLCQERLLPRFKCTTQ